MIYFAQSTDGGPINIGYSADVIARIRQLEVRYGRSLAVLATMPGGPEREAEIHERFAHLRLNGKKGRGRQPEQFRPTAELMEFIGRPLLVGANPDAVEAMGSTHGITVGIRATEEWADWLDRAAKHCRLDIAKFIDKATAEYARSNGFTEKPPERVP